jgi:hypothetical protein
MQERCVFRSQSLPWQAAFAIVHIDPAPQDVGSLTRGGCAEEQAPCGFEVIFYVGFWI